MDYNSNLDEKNTKVYESENHQETKYNIQETDINDDVEQKKENVLIAFVFKHPLIVFMLIALPICFLIPSLKAIFYSIEGILILGIVLINTTIIYLYGTSFTDVEVSFQKTFIYMIPASFILSITGLSIFTLGGFILNGFIISILFKFSVPFRNAVLINVFLLIADLIFLFGFLFFIINVIGINLA